MSAIEEHFMYYVHRDQTFINETFKNLNLMTAIFCNCIFQNCKFDCINFVDATFVSCTFVHCDFITCNMQNVICKYRTVFDKYTEDQFPMACPKEGAFIGWKKCDRTSRKTGRSYATLVKLEIPAQAKRSSAFGKKCRCSEAKVLGFYYVSKPDKEIEKPEAFWFSSLFDSGFKYELGKTVRPKHGFYVDRFQECASGIHFFMDVKDAQNYSF